MSFLSLIGIIFLQLNIRVLIGEIKLYIKNKEINKLITIPNILLVIWTLWIAVGIVHMFNFGPGFYGVKLFK